MSSDNSPGKTRPSESVTVAYIEPQTPHARDTVRSRRPHRKSRGGCKRCKTRRVKCDERRPICSGCDTRGAPCEYFDTPCLSGQDSKPRVEIPPLRQHSSTNASQCSSTTSTPKDTIDLSPSDARCARCCNHTCSHCLPPTSIVGVGTPEDRLLDLRLFHHYHKMATQSSKSQNIWSTWVADAAISSSTLMDAVLGFSAFHLRQLNVTDPAICKASHMYMARAIRSHNEELQNGITEQNADTVVAAGSLILFHASVNQPYLAGAGAGYQLPLHWFRPFHGAGILFGKAWPLIKGGVLGNLLQSTWLMTPPVLLPVKSDAFDFLLADLDDEGDIDPETILAYRLAVANLAFIFSSPRYATLLRFPTVVSGRFIDLLEVKDPRTLAIVGYFFMLVKIARPLWWVDGAPEREFRAVMSFLPEDWWPMMDWAIKEFEWSRND